MQDRFRLHLSQNAIAYTCRQLAQRAGIVGGSPQGTGFEGLDITIHYARPDRIHPDRPGIIVVPCSDAWGALLGLTPHSLAWLPAKDVVPEGSRLPFDDPVPVLFWGEGFDDGDASFAELRSDGSVIIHADIIAATFFMLSRWEETIVATRDEHDRFPGTSSVAYKQGFLDRPIVDEYALILGEWLKVLLPSWEPKERSYKVKLSHDVDKVYHFPDWNTGFRALGGDLLKRRSPRRAWHTGLEVTAQLIAPERTRYFKGIWRLARLSQEYGYDDDAFYFMATDPGPMESDYDLASPFMKRCIDNLREQGFEIGIHAGYHTLKDPIRLAEEKARLDNALGETEYGGRQHYLRFQAPDTWRDWERVGLSYDATMSYADLEGFRCGTCHSFRPFDVEQNRELDIIEIPLIAMDSTLRNYSQLSPEQSEVRILELAKRCQQVGGTFTLLWHNSSLDGEWRPWVETYLRVLALLSEDRFS